MIKIVKNARIVNEGEILRGDIVVENDKIAAIETSAQSPKAEEVFDAQGAVLLPGIIDTHVHFREPGMTDAATIYSESRAAAAGGVTSYFDMPNNIPATTTLPAIQAKREIAKNDSLVNYSFYLGATSTNIDEIKALDPRNVCGVKVFMGSSTGNMLVDGADTLREIFAGSPIPIVTHCEDMDIINGNSAEIRKRYGEKAGVEWHAFIRNAEACYRSSSLAVKLAKEENAQLHVAHITTEKELALFAPGDEKITAEVCVPHLVFCDEDYKRLGALIKCNPAIKASSDREALRKALGNGTIYSVATDHAPHVLSRKQGGAFEAVSGMPSVQFSLVNMLALYDQGIVSLEQIARLMAHNPAKRFNVINRGYLREGCYADFVIARRGEEYELDNAEVLSKCGWTPFAGRKYAWYVERTYSNGECVYSREGGIVNGAHSKEIEFDR